jgi:mono/diheme cytochrome c family protein
MKMLHGCTVRGIVLGCLISLVLTVTVVLPASAQEATEKLYKQKCQSCHAADGSGATGLGKKTRARDFGSAEEQNETDAQLIEIIAKGKNKMPGYEKSLTDTQIKDQAAYCRAMGKKK